VSARSVFQNPEQTSQHRLDFGIRLAPRMLSDNLVWYCAHHAIVIPQRVGALAQLGKNDDRVQSRLRERDLVP
jgi:hypothetical protein